jgi:hypothetical protein
MLWNAKSPYFGRCLIGAVAIATLITACMRDTVAPRDNDRNPGYELTRSVTIKPDPFGRLLDSTVRQFGGEGYEIVNGGADSLRERAKPIKIPAAPLTDYYSDAAAIGYQVMAIELVDADGREGVFEIQMNGTGELIQNLRYYTNNEKIIKVNYQWAPVTDGFVATQVDQTVYDNDAAIGARVDTYSQTTGWVKQPLAQAYSMELGEAPKAKLAVVGRAVLATAGARKFVNMQSSNPCNNDAWRGIAQMAMAFLEIREARRHGAGMPAPDAPHDMGQAMLCIQFIAVQQGVALRNATEPLVWFYGQQVYRGFVGLGIIFDDLRRGGQFYYDVYSRRMYDFYDCAMVLGQRACASVNGRMVF